MPAPIQGYLLGVFELRQGETTLPLPATAVARSLLAYLLFHQSKTHPRPVLLGVFWPDMPERQGRRALSKALWHIRQVVPDLIQSEGDALIISQEAETAVWTDTAEFANRSASQQPESLHQALDLYRGDLLEGYYDNWVVREREWLQQRYLDILEKLLLLEKTAGHYEQALELAQNLSRQDPLEEETHREIMRLYQHLGRPQAALRQFEACRQILADELSVEPAEETIQLAQEIGRQAAISTPHLPEISAPPVPLALNPGQQLPLIGRDSERINLVGDIETAINGSGGIVLLEGAAGVGKTRLLQEIAYDAEWRGMQVWRGCAYEQRETPYGPLLTALTTGLTPLRAGQLTELVAPLWLAAAKHLIPDLSDWLPSLPELPALPPEQEHIRLLEALARLLLAQSRLNPLLVILENLHWADGATFDLLAYLARRLNASRLLIIGSFRRNEAQNQPDVWAGLQALDRFGLRRRLSLAPLEREETEAFIRYGLGLTESAPLLSARIHQETAGNPLYILETLRALHDEGLLYQEQGAWRTPWDKETTAYEELPLAGGIEQSILRRWNRLAAEEQQLLRLAAVLGSEIELPLLHALRPQNTLTLLATAGLLVERRLLEETATAYRFSHDKVRQTIYESIPAADRLDYHQQVGIALESTAPEHYDTLAHHYQAAQRWGKAAHYHRLAGEQAQKLPAYQIALTHYQTALGLDKKAGGSAENRFNLLTQQEAICGILGEQALQAASLAEMAELAQDDEKRLTAVRQRQALFLANNSQYDKAETEANCSLALARQQNDRAGEAAALIALGRIADWRGRPEGAIPYLEEAVQLSRQLADQRQEAQVQNLLGSALLGVKRYEEAADALQKSCQIYGRLSNKLGEAEVLGLLGIVQTEQNDPETAETTYLQSLKFCREIGYRYGEARTTINLANLYYLNSRYPQAIARYEEGTNLMHLLGYRRGETACRLNKASLLLAVLGETKAAEKEVKIALAYCREVGDLQQEGHGLAILGEAAWMAGAWQKGQRYCQAAVDKLLECGEKWMAVQAYRPLIASSLTGGQLDKAKGQIEEAENICLALKLTDQQLHFQALRAALLSAQKQPQEALTIARSVLQQWKPDLPDGYLIIHWCFPILEAHGRPQEAPTVLEQVYKSIQENLAGLSPEQREKCLAQNRYFREIVTAYETYLPTIIEVRLPRIDAPTGRPLEAYETLPVTLTVRHPTDNAVADKVARRQRQVARLVQEAESQLAVPTVQDLAAILHASPATIKRDLAALRRKGQALKTRGSR